MRRCLIFLLLCMLLTTAVSAAGSVTELDSNTVFQSNGTCQVTVTVQLSLDEVPGQLYFPLPKAARNISINGGVARTSVSGNVRNVNLKNHIHFAGTSSFTIRYDLPDAVTAQKNGTLVLNLDILSGFAYPIESMDFSITLPGAPEKRPEFTSTYHQQTVDMLMSITTEGNTIHCRFLQGLKDHESLSMTLEVSEALFPQPLMKRWSLSADDVAMYICALLAIVYWVIFLRALPPARVRRTQEPVGLTAGELGCSLTGRGVDFVLMVISWAQMGYLLIQLDDNGRVLLHKRMDMGNERKDFESRSFRTLFGRRKTVDGTGYHFARLVAKTGRTVSGFRDTYLPKSGNPRLFRALCAGIGAFGGVSMARSLANDTVWQVILGLLLAVLGAILSWYIQNAAMTIHLRKRWSFWISLGAGLIYLLISALLGEAGVALFVLGSQWLGGLACGYGGRRSELGRQNVSEILGLRRYLRTVSKEELQRIQTNNPEYYYTLAPYALALGMDGQLARQMGNAKLTECTYLTTGMDGHLTAKEWNRLLREVVKILDERQQRLALQKFLGR